jgi:hypothetical protein
MPIQEVLLALGGGSVVPVPIPHDCQDGFTRAFWRRPEAHLDPHILGAMSTFAAMGREEAEAGLRRLAQDPETGAWSRRFGHLLELDECDLGYRLVVAGP